MANHKRARIGTPHSYARGVSAGGGFVPIGRGSARPGARGTSIVFVEQHIQHVITRADSDYISGELQMIPKGNAKENSPNNVHEHYLGYPGGAG